MTKPLVEKRFFFHANAVALAAHIRREEEFFVPAVASSCLPVTGGIGNAAEQGKAYRNIIAFESAATSVFGDFTDRARAAAYTFGNHDQNELPTVTVVEGKIIGLRITVGRRVLQATMNARMESFSDRKTPTRFHTLSANFQSVSLDGVGIRVQTHTDIFEKFDTKEKLCKEWSTNKDFRAAHADHFFSPRPVKTGWFTKPAIPQARGLIYGTIVSGLTWTETPAGGSTIQGNRITIDGLGSLYFGEILIEEGIRRLTLLRFQLGSPEGGDGCAVDIQSNGTGWPPRFNEDQ